METTSEEPCPAAFVAIDWADAKHTVCIWLRPLSLDIATFSGIAPVIMRSGKICQVHWRWACPKFLRRNSENAG
jgi:hypothetical protein